MTAPSFFQLSQHEKRKNKRKTDKAEENRTSASNKQLIIVKN